MRLIRYTVIALILMFATPAFADYLPEESDAEASVPTKERVKAFLESDRYVLSRLELRELTEDVVADLIAVASDKRVRAQTRARAIQSLGLYADDDRSVKAVADLYSKARPGQKLFEVLLVTHVQVGGSGATESVIHYLDHSKPSVRRSVVVALGRFGGQMAFELLKARKSTEPDPEVRALIAKYVD